MFRRRVDPRKLAGRAARLKGDLPLESLPRIAALLAGGAHASYVRASLDFEIGARGLVLLSGEIDACLTLQCQRCLEPVSVPVTSSFRLALREASGGEALPQGFELLEDTGDGIVPADLVEEEILLALPFAAAHASVSECGELAERLAVPGPAEQSEHPFGRLKDLQPD